MVADGKDWIHTLVLDQFAGERAAIDRGHIASSATIPTRHDLMRGRFGNPLHEWLPLERDALTLPEALCCLRRKMAPRRMQRLWRDDPDAVEVPTPTDYIRPVRRRSMRGGATLEGNVH